MDHREQVFIIVAFESTHDAIKSETLTGRESIASRLIPIPPEVSAGCGLALRIEPEAETLVRRILSEANVHGSYYLLRRDGIKRTVESLEK